MIITKLIAKLIFFSALLFLILFVRQLFLKGVRHFSLLKVLYPHDFKKYSSFWEFMQPHNFYTEDLIISFWLITPYYFSRIPENRMSKEALDLHRKLIDNNKKMLVLLALFILSIVSLGALGYISST